ncbi:MULTISPECIES: tannase/feruloyl esterase family alpha/beta hydrolase [unclassified Duganella]|uniref:tannase/feruloyl esterase family alpha/beta hydrolase n=1 Tax=unclassified Duganella TaxID=2636909 RepID=UPI000E34A939|nr:MULTISPECIES: tannase/feruloyl esterase family alpha/beta hydrolase [unclassified Duganella]RFP19266.1 tannase/feruloyl esterase family alpha/beta hydrolase [Duganella sp. BJB475]RFP35847.1 tannase/feruloyl esterase family alpha/beta hydrolase [Duganella sp. BJB476]
MMIERRVLNGTPLAALCLSAVALSGCGGDGGTVPSATAALPQLAAASGAKLSTCTDLASKIAYPNTTIASAASVAAGVLTVAGKPVPAHCLVKGSMYQRVGPVDGQNYAISFEMRLPVDWNGRFFFQANGGLDGAVVTATGDVGGGGQLDNALNQGFAVISSDAGHGAATPLFGLDPQARLDYGYQASGKLAPMAKSVIQTAYGKGPDRSYFGGCSNGGRHTMVAASRYGEQFDGYLVGDPGFRLPLAAIANIAGGQSYAALATTPGDLSTGFTPAERALVSNTVLDKCDALDGVKDGLVQDTGACQAAFSLERDVPSCGAQGRDGTCLSTAQKAAIGQLFTGALTSTKSKFYSSFPYDAGLGTGNWAFWKFFSPLQLDSGAVAMIWKVPPVNPATFNGASFALTSSIDTLLTQVAATDGSYTESAMSFMLPPHLTDYSTVKNRGAKMMLYHGTSDPIFSSDDTTAWYDNLRAANGGDASNFARFFRVPGMNHCSGGPATDQFDMLTPLVNWVEKGQAPERVLASARGAGNAGGVNADVPASWSTTRTRPLCPYPQVAKYNGSGSIEDAANFSCK